jgi:hypothetical protein
VLTVLRVISVVLFAAGLGALVAWLVSRSLTTSVDFAWAASLHTFALTLALLFIPAAVGATLLMPSQTALVRDIRGEENPPLPLPLTLLLVVLCAAAALQVQPVAAPPDPAVVQPRAGDGRARSQPRASAPR